MTSPSELDRRRAHSRAYQARRYAMNPEPAKAASKAWAQKNKVRMYLAQAAGRYVVWATMTGLLKKPDACEGCGRTECVIEAAHADYGKPLEVEWLCRACHRAWDAETPKTMPTLEMRVF